MKSTRLLTVLLLVSALTQAQNLHVGVFGGTSSYIGDLAEKKIFPKHGATNGAFGVTLAYEYNDHINIRGGYIYGRLGGNDGLSESLELKERNLSFESDIHDFSVVGEYNIFSLYERRFTPYLFAGIGAFHFNPYAFDRNGVKRYLKPLSTEGQGVAGYPESKPYSLTQVNIPLGIGFKFAINDDIRLGIEGSYRKLFTDHLDDVGGFYADEQDLLNARGPVSADMAYRGDESTVGNQIHPGKGVERGNKGNKDAYYFVGLHLAFRLGSLNNGGFGGGRKGKGYGCPSNLL